MEFVCDRTATDVSEKTAKGVINASDLNRIEGNISELAEIFDISATTKTWSVGGLPRASDYARILQNTKALRETGVLSTTPAVPSQPVNTYGKWNNIEKILFVVNDLHEGTERTRIYCGDGVCAGDEV